MDGDLRKLVDYLSEPDDYFSGVGSGSFPSPKNLLLFARHDVQELQQQALANKSHHRFVLLVAVEGAGTVHVNHRGLTVNPGEALLIHPYQFHYYSGIDRSKFDWLFITFEFEPEDSLVSLKYSVLDLPRQAREILKSFVAHYLASVGQKKVNYVEEFLLQAQLQRILLMMLKQQLGVDHALVEQQGETGSGILNDINRLLMERAGKVTLLTDFAEALSMSESRLRAVFREQAGVSLGEYLRNYRLNRAMGMLRNSQLPIAEVADLCGYGSLQAFSRAFSNSVGQSPMAYRQRKPVPEKIAEEPEAALES
ncbi:helix-turn-helix transcriptional regulator [Persicirhabdus sediminis]|uniref:AraC family transcriptional regulator n=1 Tax=Persicirhabdus sediminis TaxID=454144 RepID=A0A8J7MFY1_9BACT|nr:AraC family transcriptional regulator [Persicirhabdus sediminis]MBK1792392.1 AraC family transcriptional regulator [Persicirhabdus sediminis]